MFFIKFYLLSVVFYFIMALSLIALMSDVDMKFPEGLKMKMEKDKKKNRRLLFLKGFIPVYNTISAFILALLITIGSFNHVVFEELGKNAVKKAIEKYKD